MTETTVYLIQIAGLLLCLPLLVACIAMVYQSRAALNGLMRGLIALLSLLIVLIVLLCVRRFDDAFNVFDNSAALIFSSIVVLVSISIVILVTVDLYYLYRNRELYTIWRVNQRERIEELETMRERSERAIGKWSS